MSGQFEGSYEKTEETNDYEDVLQSARSDVGIFSSNKKGFGFIKVEDGSEDVFIPAKAVNGAFHNDIVRFKITRTDTIKGNREGCIVEVLEHKIKSLVGTYIDCERFGFVRPDMKKLSSDIFVRISDSMEAKEDDKVIVEITNYGDAKKGPAGKITEILGQKGEQGVDVLSIIRERGIPISFSDEVISASQNIHDDISEEEIKGRLDKRGEKTYTIDGEETKDYDDAISITKSNDRYFLGVHIADVTHYVKEDSPLDKEAKIRGTSVYPVDRVIPMLPEKLSEGVCSLVEGQPRLTLSCLMEIDLDGNVLKKEIAETVISVDKRLSYNQVAEALDNPENLSKDMEEAYPDMVLLKEVSDKLNKKRVERGAIDFEFPEAVVKLDEHGFPVEIVPRGRNTATQIIEELMLAANEAVARYVSLSADWRGTPLIYRSHELPDVESLANLKRQVTALGFNFQADIKDIKPKDIQKLVDDVKGTPDEYYIQTMALRCMKRASYTTASQKKREINGVEEVVYVPVGHFGLSYEYYCHFTSPIRRYADLQNHRVIKEKLHGSLDKKKIGMYKKIFPDIAQHVSETEYRALQAERDSVRLKMAEFMKAHIGEEYDGVISGVAQWGIYVTLPNTIDGLIPVASLEDGYYTYDEAKLELVRETGGRVFRIGQKLRIKVEDADIDLRNVTFKLVKEY